MPESDTPPATPPTDPPPCDNGGPNPPGNDFGDPNLPFNDSFSEAPVRYFDGTVYLKFNDLTSNGLGEPWGQTRSWTNAAGYAAVDFAGHPMGYNGNGMVDMQLPFVLTNANFSTAIVITSGTSMLVFDNINSTNPTPRFFVTDRFLHANGEFVLSDNAGNQTHFYDFTGAPNNPRWGKFKSYIDAEGNVTQVTSWTADGRPAEIQRQTPANQSPQVIESYLFSYVSSGVNQGLYSNVTLRRQIGGGTWTVVRQVDYTYYNTGEANGNANDLKSATVKDAAGNPLDTTYYRYYPRQGSFDGLKYLFRPDSYARLVAAVGDPLTTNLTDTQVAPFADNYFEYDGQRRATKEIAQATCSSTTGGLGTFTYSYSTSNFSDTGPNTWHFKTIETLPDNSATFVSRNIVYANTSGETMLKVYESGAPGHTQQWDTYFKYDNAGRIILQAMPSAVTGFDETKPDLLNNVAGHYQYLQDRAGELKITDYYASTTATETTPGGVAGFLQDSKLQQGQLGTAVLQSSKQYYARTGSLADVTVTTPGGTSAASTADQFHYVTPTAPALSGLSLTTGTTLGNDTIVVTGTGFTGATAVVFDGTVVTNINVLTDTAISLRTPAHAAGVVDVTVLGPGGTSLTTSADQFTYVAPPVPTVTALNFTSTSILGGSLLIITGSGFSGATQVAFDTTTTNNFDTQTDQAISVRVPAHAAGAVDVTVTTPGGTSATTAADRFTFVTPPAPVVTSLSQTSGSVLGGSTIMIFGTDFTGATRVDFGTIQVPFSYNIYSDTAISVRVPAGTAGTVDVTVIGPGGISAMTAADHFTFVTPPAPVVTSLSQTSASLLGGATIMVFGTGFSGATRVNFGPNPVTFNFTVITDTAMSVRVPAGTAGTVDVTVVTPGGTSATSAADRFTFATPPAPVVTGIGPPVGLIAGGAYVTIIGSNFSGATAVSFGGTPSTYVSADSDNAITTRVPAHAVGMVDVTVTTPGGTSAVTAADQFNYVTNIGSGGPPPVVTGLAAVSGSTLGGLSITIIGSSFTGATQVSFGSTQVNSVNVLSDNAIRVTVLAHTAGVVDVTVTTPGGTSATSAADHFTYVNPPTPVVTGLNQTSGSVLGGTDIIITGSGFSNANQVNFGTLQVRFQFSVISDSAIRVNVPTATTAGAVDVTVMTPGGTSATSAADRYTYVNPPTPVVTGLNQTSDSVLGGSNIIINGSGFSGATLVNFGSLQVRFSYSIISDSAIRVTVPTATTAGAVDVTVVTPGGTSATSAADRFTFVNPPAPVVTSLTPVTGSTLGGMNIMVLGTGFSGATLVNFGSTQVRFAFGIISDSAIRVTVPAGTAGPVDVTVVTPGGISATSAADRFTFANPVPPVVTRLGQVTGNVQGGTDIIVIGTGFNGATLVNFGSAQVRFQFSIISDSAIRVTVPAGTAGPVDVTVVTPGGTSATSAADRYTYVLPAVPAVSGVGAASGSTAGGYYVTVIGSNFGGATAVSFGGERSTDITVNSDTTVTARVPAHIAGAVDVKVTTPGGTSMANAGDQFTYTAPAPVVTGLSPATGLVAGGYFITLIGTNFTGAVAVIFGGALSSSFSVDTDNSISVRVPAHDPGAVDVQVISLGSTSTTNTADQFTYVTTTGTDGPAPAVTGVGRASGSIQGGYRVNIIGTSFTGATAVTFGTVRSSSFSVSSANVINAVVPAQAAGTVDVRVTTPQGTSAITAADQFTYLPLPVPVITGVSLATGSTLGGYNLTAIGSGFTGATDVSFSGSSSTSFNVTSDNSISVRVPAFALATIYPIATSTVYRNTDGTGAETTSYAYTWFPGTTHMLSMTTSRPVVSAAQNGPGTADVQTTVYDTYGRPVWTRDGDGFITYAAYDTATGAVIKTIKDVDTTRTSDFQNLPAGWSTPPGGGLHLETQMQVDGLGRDTQVVDPNGNMTYTVFKDANHEIRSYIGWNAATGLPTGPTVVVRKDRSHSPSYVETLTMSATPNVDGNGVPDGSEPISQVQALTRTFTSPGGQVIEVDPYVSLVGVNYSTSPYLGTAGANYYPTTIAYDSHGRPNRTLTPTGTVYRSVYDGLGRVVSTWVGTNDAGATDTDPTGNGTPGNNMVETTANVYDNGGAGDSDLTQVTQFPGGGAAPRVTQYFYDWRDRQVAIKQGVQASENDGTHRPIIYRQYDNLSEVVSLEQYDGDTINITVTNGVPDRPPAARLRAKTTTQYDDHGRVFRTDVYSVDPNNGTVSSTGLETNTWYNHRGKVIKTAQPGGLATKDGYDGAGRQVAAYVTDGLGDTTWADARSVANNNVLEETDTQYDGDGNAILVIQRDRFHDETRTGALGDANSTTLAKARAYYVAMYYDAANRLTDSVDVGTNGGTVFVPPVTPPAGSATVLVTHTDYDAAGWVADMMDPRGLGTTMTHDMLGRITQTIEAYTDGNPTDSTNRTTAFTYDGDNHIVAETAYLADGSTQTTRYVYGVTGTINSNDLLASVTYPDNGMNLTENYRYNALGQRVGMTDRNGTTHSYTYDVLGRQTVDAVTTLGAGVDGQVQRLETAFNSQGLPYLFTSYDAPSGGNIVNQVERIFNGLGQLTAEYQSHAGAVNTSSTPAVRYAYSEMAGGANHSRLVSMTDPNGRVITYNYGAGLDDRISRLTSIADTTGILEAYVYLGLVTVVKRAHPQDGVDLTYIKQTGEPIGDAGDQYTGLDRFGRVVDERWLNTSTGTATDRFQYGYDRDNNPLYRDNLVNPAFGELYEGNGTDTGYDSLNRLTDFNRGTLNATHDGIVGTPSVSENWSLNAVGDWQAVTTNGTTSYRDHNAQNQIVDIDGNPLTYDNNGNLLTDQAGNSYTYDAWNRMVAVQDVNGNTLGSYAYDALGRQIVQTGVDLYFSKDWQVVEERQGGVMQTQYVWSPVYVDALVERDTNGGPRLYVQQDASYNVTAVVDTTGIVQERYIYDPYGQATILAPDWSTRGASAVGWVYLFQAGRLDPATSLYQHRYRDASPTLGRWVEQDPLRYVDGMNLYNNVRNNPIGYTDPSGLYAFWDDLIVFGVGAALGAGGQALGDLFVRGSLSTWQSYAAAAIGGGVGAEAAYYTGSPVIGGAVGGAVGNGLDQIFNHGFSNFDWTALGLNTALGAGAGYLAGWPKIDGINAGRGSWEAIENWLKSGLENGSFSSFSGQTGAKIAGAEGYNGLLPAGLGGIGSALIDKLLDWLRGNDHGPDNGPNNGPDNGPNNGPC
jgi:RHS repeat-associated protein